MGLHTFIGQYLKIGTFSHSNTKRENRQKQQ